MAKKYKFDAKRGTDIIRKFRAIGMSHDEEIILGVSIVIAAYNQSGSCEKHENCALAFANHFFKEEGLKIIELK